MKEYKFKVQPQHVFNMVDNFGEEQETKKDSYRINLDIDHGSENFRNVANLFL